MGFRPVAHLEVATHAALVDSHVAHCVLAGNEVGGCMANIQ